MAEKKAVNNKPAEMTNEEIDAYVDQLVSKAQVALSKFEDFTQERADPLPREGFLNRRRRRPRRIRGHQENREEPPIQGRRQDGRLSGRASPPGLQERPHP